MLYSTGLTLPKLVMDFFICTVTCKDFSFVLKKSSISGCWVLEISRIETVTNFLKWFHI
jgi:hypothetical protein